MRHRKVQKRKSLLAFSVEGIDPAVWHARPPARQNPVGACGPILKSLLAITACLGVHHMAFLQVTLTKSGAGAETRVVVREQLRGSGQRCIYLLPRRW